MTEHELLDRFIDARDEGAFAEIVCRYLDFVWGIARRQTPESAEDVAQAVFLVLSQKPRQVQLHQNLTGWLFRTTLYCCKNLKRTEGRRMRHEHAAGTIASTKDDAVPPELSGLLDESLEKLPEVYREAVLVRYLEGRSIAEAAKSLGISEAATAKRAARGLERLRAQFAQAGFSVGVAAVSSLLAGESAKAAPTRIVGNIAGLTSDKAIVTVKAATLAHGAGKAAVSGLSIKAATAVAGLLLASGVVATAGYFLTGHPIQPAAAMMVSAPPPPVSPASVVDESKIPGDLHIARYDVLLDSVGAAALQNLSHALPAKSEFLEVRQARAADIRAALNSLTQQGHVPGSGSPVHGDLPPRIPGFPWNGTLILPSLGSGHWYVDVKTPAGTRYMESLDEMLGYAEERAGNVDIRFGFDNCGMSLHYRGETPALSDSVEKTAALHWNGTLGAGDDLLLCGDWGEFHGDHFVAVRIIETYKATAAESPFVTRMENPQWLEGGPAGARLIADQSLVWAAAGEQKWLADKDAWTRRLSDGTIVRLMAIARPAQYSFCWWNPDGIPTADQYDSRIIGATRNAYAAAVKVLQPAFSLRSDPDGWFNGAVITLPDGDKHLDVYIGTGPWTQQTIKPNEQVLIGDDYYVRLRRPRPHQRTFLLEGFLGYDTDVGLAAVTKSGLFISGNRSYEPGILVTSETLMWKYGDFILPIDPEEIDHYVLLTRKREQVSFDNFADAPVSTPPDTVTPDQVRQAEQAVARMHASASTWDEIWQVKKGELDRVDQIPRDGHTPLGAMRLMIDNARAGNQAGVQPFLHSEDPLLAERCAAALTSFGKIYVLAEKRFGREALLKVHSSQLLMLEATYLEPDCQLSGVPVFSGVNFVPLIPNAGGWAVDLDRFAAIYKKEQMLDGCSKLITAAAAFEKDLAAGAIKDPGDADNRMWSLRALIPALWGDLP
jgi:RNA polymerase sigma factor (sigma-70 family)